MGDDVQPAAPVEGQGADTTDSGYAKYLDSVAPEIREQVEPLFKEFDGNVTKKFQEHAEYRKGWAPYEELGINELDPGQVKGLLDFANLAKDPEQFSEWWKAAGDEVGLFDKFGGQDDSDLGLEDDLSPEKVKELVEKQVAERLGPVEKTLQEQEQERKASEANAEVADAMKAIRSDNASLFEGDEAEQKETERVIGQFAYSYSDDKALTAAQMIQKGFEDFQKVVGRGEKSLFADKSKQPPPPEGAGGADTSPEKISSFDDPRLKTAMLAKVKSG